MIQHVTASHPSPPHRHSYVCVTEAGTEPAFRAGSVPWDAGGNLVGADAPVRRAQQVTARPPERLRAVGSDPAHVPATGAGAAGQGHGA
nr:hypothetical protein StreXyl84_48400 [Streptomyces sp. Xyl84]